MTTRRKLIEAVLMAWPGSDSHRRHLAAEAVDAVLAVLKGDDSGSQAYWINAACERDEWKAYAQEAEAELERLRRVEQAAREVVVGIGIAAGARLSARDCAIYEICDPLRAALDPKEAL